MKRHASGRASFTEWLSKIRYGDWEHPADILATFPSADLLGNGSNRAVFDIGGKYAFGDKQVHLFICWIGTHAQYNRPCATNEQYTKSDY